jgi:hypothetical protein
MYCTQFNPTLFYASQLYAMRLTGIITLISSLQIGDEKSHEQETTTSFTAVGMHDMMHLHWIQVKAVE